jgi:hypothetical protein
MYPGNGESFSWVYDTNFIKDVPFVAYFRLKVSNNTSSGPVASLSVKGGGTEYGPLVLKGTDFQAANVYQEFPIHFTFNTNPSDAFLIFQFTRTGSADVTVDAVSIFTAPQPFASPAVWAPPDGNYRGQGVWVRTTDSAGHFSAFSEAQTVLSTLNAQPEALSFLVERNGSSPREKAIQVSSSCTVLGWQASDVTGRLQTRVSGNVLWVSVNPAGLNIGKTVVNLTLAAINSPGVAPVIIPVTLQVFDHVPSVYLPALRR